MEIDNTALIKVRQPKGVFSVNYSCSPKKVLETIFNRSEGGALRVLIYVHKTDLEILLFEWMYRYLIHTSKTLVIYKSKIASITEHKKFFYSKVLDNAKDSGGLPFTRPLFYKLTNSLSIRKIVQEKNPKCILVDSIQLVNHTTEEIKELFDEHPKTSFIIISRSGPAVKLRGIGNSGNFSHLFDVRVNIAEQRYATYQFKRPKY